MRLLVPRPGPGGVTALESQRGHLDLVRICSERSRVHCGGSLMVPQWYRTAMAMNLRLSDAETEALRRKADEEGRSMQEVARAAIAEYVTDRPGRLRAAIERVRSEDQELLDRLSR